MASIARESRSTFAPPRRKVVAITPYQTGPGPRFWTARPRTTLFRAGVGELDRPVLPVGPEIDHQVRAAERNQVMRFGTPDQRRRPARRVVAHVPSQEDRLPERAIEELLPRDQQRVQPRREGNARTVAAPRQRHRVGSDAPARVHHHEIERLPTGCIARFSLGTVVPVKPMYLG